MEDVRHATPTRQRASSTDAVKRIANSFLEKAQEDVQNSTRKLDSEREARARELEEIRASTCEQESVRDIISRFSGKSQIENLQSHYDRLSQQRNSDFNRQSFDGELDASGAGNPNSPVLSKLRQHRGSKAWITQPKAPIARRQTTRPPPKRLLDERYQSWLKKHRGDSEAELEAPPDADADAAAIERLAQERYELWLLDNPAEPDKDSETSEDSETGSEAGSDVAANTTDQRPSTPTEARSRSADSQMTPQPMGSDTESPRTSGSPRTSVERKGKTSWFEGRSRAKDHGGEMAEDPSLSEMSERDLPFSPGRSGKKKKSTIFARLIRVKDGAGGGVSSRFNFRFKVLRGTTSQQMAAQAGVHLPQDVHDVASKRGFWAAEDEELDEEEELDSGEEGDVSDPEFAWGYVYRDPTTGVVDEKNMSRQEARNLSDETSVNLSGAAAELESAEAEGKV